MKLYTLTRKADGVHLFAETALRNGGILREKSGPLDIGSNSPLTQTLALAIMNHYYGAKPEDPAATAEAQRRAAPFLGAFLIHHRMQVGDFYEISSDVIDSFISKIP